MIKRSLMAVAFCYCRRCVRVLPSWLTHVGLLLLLNCLSQVKKRVEYFNLLTLVSFFFLFFVILLAVVFGKDGTEDIK